MHTRFSYALRVRAVNDTKRYRIYHDMYLHVTFINYTYQVLFVYCNTRKRCSLFQFCE